MGMTIIASNISRTNSDDEEEVQTDADGNPKKKDLKKYHVDGKLFIFRRNKAKRDNDKYKIPYRKIESENDIEMVV